MLVDIRRRGEFEAICPEIDSIERSDIVLLLVLEGNIVGLVFRGAGAAILSDSLGIDAQRERMVAGFVLVVVTIEKKIVED